MDLVILAGGMGSRFGGLKQIEPIDNDGNFIIDYSIFDAIRAGFNRIIFVIKRENLQDFKTTVGRRIESKIKVEYAFQELDSFVDTKKYNINGRVKPWGTAHAILCAKNLVSKNFAIINADDFYGETSFRQIAEFLKENKKPNTFAMVGYTVGNTITENGEVKRGLCILENWNLKGFEESIIKQENGQLFSKPIASTGEFNKLDDNALVSMNLFGFTPKVFEYLQEGFNKFLEDNKQNLQVCEYYIPTILSHNINNGNITISVKPTREKWFGLTYKSDFDIVKKGLENLKTKKIYPNNLWEN